VHTKAVCYCGVAVVWWRCKRTRTRTRPGSGVRGVSALGRRQLESVCDTHESVFVHLRRHPRGKLVGPAQPTSTRPGIMEDDILLPIDHTW
jgi:hypothetical protein